jgi:hypothetical protein
VKIVTSALALAALALAACNSGNANVGARFAGPAAIAPFAGNLHKAGGKLRDYLAVASSRADEIVVIDPSDEQPVLGPGAVFPLSIPTDPRPVRLAAATLGDRGDVGGADLLVVVSSGSLVLQLVNTWNPDAAQVEDVFSSPAPDGTPRPGAGGSIDLSTRAELAAAEILSVTAFPFPQRDASGTVTLPRARVVAGLTGGRIAIVDFVRGAPRQGEDAASPPVVPTSTPDAQGTPVATVTLQTIGVDPLDLAVDPDATRLFAATRDAVGNDASGNPLFGVMQVQVLEDPAATWPTTGLGANAPTLVVAAARVSERNVFLATDPDAADTFDPSAGLVRVYAALDQDGPNACGPQRLISCGVATLEPRDTPGPADVALAPDFASLGVAPPTGGVTPPVPAMGVRGRAPMQVPGTVTSIAVALPVARGTERVPAGSKNGDKPLITVEHAYGPRVTPAVAAVTSTTGNVYLLDLGRGAPVNDVSFALNSLPGVTTAATTAAGGTAQLVLRADFPVVPSARQSTDAASTAVDPVTNPAVLARLVQVTPGFTGNHDYALTWQGALPGLDTRPAVLAVDATGAAFVGVQLRKAAGADASASSWVVGAQVAAPELGVRVGDIAVVQCSTGAPEPKIAAILPGDAPGAPQVQAGVAFPGGALRLDSNPCGAVPGAPPQEVTLTVRAPELVLTRGVTGQGAHVEYVGRPPPFDATSITTGVVHALQWQPETSALSPEQLALARLARRVFYSEDNPCSSTPAGCPNTPWFVDPLTPGPVVAFKVAVLDPAVPPSTDHLARNAAITFTTVSGYSPAFRRPVTAGVLPRALAVFDRTKFAGHENDPIRLYATYLDDEVLSFSPRDATGVVRSIR